MIPLSLSTHPLIKTAVICPPTIFGKGRGTGSTRLHQIYELARLSLERGEGILIPGHDGEKGGGPKTFWPNVHVDDLARLYLEVVESAAVELEGKKGKATWGEEGYYFAENGVHYVRELLYQSIRMKHTDCKIYSGRMSWTQLQQRLTGRDILNVQTWSLLGRMRRMI